MKHHNALPDAQIAPPPIPAEAAPDVIQAPSRRLLRGAMNWISRKGRAEVMSSHGIDFVESSPIPDQNVPTWETMELNEKLLGKTNLLLQTPEADYLDVEKPRAKQALFAPSPDAANGRLDLPPRYTHVLR